MDNELHRVIQHVSKREVIPDGTTVLCTEGRAVRYGDIAMLE